MTAPARIKGTVTNRRLPLYILAAAGCLFILAGIGLSLAQHTRSPLAGTPGSSNLPRQIAGLPLTSDQGGEAALEEIESMHGKGFALTGGQVAHYGDATLWVARAKDVDSARQMIESMTARIAEGVSPFQPTGDRQTNGHVVYTLNGMGQSHFYWQAGDQVAWLAIAAEKSEQGLREALAALDQR